MGSGRGVFAAAEVVFSNGMHRHIIKLDANESGICGARKPCCLFECCSRTLSVRIFAQVFGDTKDDSALLKTGESRPAW